MHINRASPTSKPGGMRLDGRAIVSIKSKRYNTAVDMAAYKHCPMRIHERRCDEYDRTTGNPKRDKGNERCTTMMRGVVSVLVG